MTDRLSQFAEKYGSDKVSSIFHSYTPFYDELLGKMEVHRVLEIGIGTPNSMCHLKTYEVGASLRMWRDYFPQAEIWGLDNDASALFGDDRIHTMICNQSQEESLSKAASLLNKRFDLIVDDGSHQVHDQALTANIFIPKLLAKNGIYVIEDVMYRRELYALLPFPVEVKVFNLGRTWDDCIFYVQGKNVVGL